MEIVQAEAKSLMERIDQQLSQYQTVTLNKETQQLTKQEMKKQAHPFYQSLAAAKTSRAQVTTQEKEASVKRQSTYDAVVQRRSSQKAMTLSGGQRYDNRRDDDDN